MDSLTTRIKAGVALSFLSVPFTCGGGIGLMMGEGPMADGRIGQPAWQKPASFAVVVGAFLLLALGLRLLSFLRKDSEPSGAVRYLQLLGFALAIGTLCIAGLAISVFGQGSPTEGTALIALTLGLGSLSYYFWSAKAS